MCETHIYIDVYFLSNFIMNTFLLILLCLIFSIASNAIRIIAASCTGAMVACIFLVTGIVNCFYIAYILHNIIMPVIMIIIVSYKKIMINPRSIIRYVCVFYLLAFCMNGIMVHFTDGIVTLRFMLLVIVCVITITFVVFGRNKAYDTKNENEEIYRVKITKDNRKIEGLAYYDSGNSLYEPISGAMVIVGEYKKIYSFLTEGEIKYIDMYPELPDTWDGETQIRIIPFSSLGNKKDYMPAIKIDKVLIEKGRSKAVYANCYLAVYDGKLSANGSYTFLLQCGMKI